MEGDTHPELHPQTRRHLRNTRKLRAAALQEFTAHGLHGTKVSSIVAAAQLTQPSFYRTWPSKEAAYEELIAQTLDTWHHVAEGILSGRPTLSLEQRLGGGVQRLYATLTQDMALTRLVLHDPTSNSGRRLPFISIYSRAFEAAQRDGHVATLMPAESLAQMYAAITERFFFARLYANQKSMTATVKEVTRLLLPTLQPAASPLMHEEVDP
ncbi:TetR/AcrR family transcriptional regulator [Deinococcus radiopugnans]|nr:TetR/AcrR family transcriptional regulator [Deinococcus radiopugnans]MBB6018871.1 AcrR family transcriptional regulator [Deinococcus radiopugnans ATCC 19172]